MSVPALAQVGASVLNLSAISGSSLPQSQIFGVSSTGAALPVKFSVRYFTTTEGWLSATADGPIRPSNITVNSAGLAPGVAIPVALTVGSGGAIGGFSVSPSSLNFLYQTGTSNPAAQSTYVSNCNGIVNYAASSNVSWLRLTSVNNSIPAQTVTGASSSNLTVYVDPSGLSPGFYSANITVGVTLTVSGSSLLAASPSSFVFNYNLDAGVPTAQQTVITATATLVAFTASANSTGGSNGLIVSVSPREPAC